MGSGTERSKKGYNSRLLVLRPFLEKMLLLNFYV